MPQFSLLDLKPEGHTFRDTTGEIYQVPTARLFGTDAYGRLTWLQTNLPAALKELADAPDGETMAAVTQVDQVVNQFFQMLVPDMPEPRVHQLALADKLGFINWWQQEEQKAAPQSGGAQAGKPVTRGRRSPASAASTTSRPPKS